MKNISPFGGAEKTCMQREGGYRNCRRKGRTSTREKWSGKEIGPAGLCRFKKEDQTTQSMGKS